MFDLISTILAWLYSVWPSYGGAIMLLTVAVMLITTPLTITGTKSMIKMQRLQPELKRIQNQYKDDKEEMNTQVMAFYQANGINPVGGCLPMFVQMPVFIVLYQVIRGLTRRVSDLGISSGYGAGVSGSDGSLSLVPELDISDRFNPQYLDSGTELYRDLTSSNEMPFLGVFDLATTAREALSLGIVDFLPYLVLIIVVGVMGFVQQRQIQGRQKPGAVNPQQQAIMRFMPFFLPVISFSLQAALVVYFFISNLYRILQQGYITRALYGGSDEAIDVVYPEGLEPGAKKPKKAKSDRAAKTGSNKGSNTAKTKEADKRLRGADKAGAAKSGRAGRIGGGVEPKSDSKKKPKLNKAKLRKAKPEKNSSNGSNSEGPKSGDVSGRTTPKGTIGPHPRKKKRKR
ncbi:MAG: YidC/Oxa1 family membrane protein insertase [Acidimicrobiales bacterium]